MTSKKLWNVVILVVIVAIVGCYAQKAAQWQVHDMNRPVPAVITPGQDNSQPPSDAGILFDGKDLSAWQSINNNAPAKWKVENGYMEVVAKAGDIATKQAFGSCQLHIEWCTPEVVKGEGQGRGNSGIFLMSRYELQVLDSYENITYADGQAGAIYGQKPPLINVCRKPGQWQAYDVIFHAPQFDGKKLVEPATITVFQNGVLVQDHWAIKGLTLHKTVPYYEPHEGKAPLRLQDHNNPTRFRNIWIRELKDAE